MSLTHSLIQSVCMCVSSFSFVHSIGMHGMYLWDNILNILATGTIVLLTIVEQTDTRASGHASAQARCRVAHLTLSFGVCVWINRRIVNETLRRSHWTIKKNCAKLYQTGWVLVSFTILYECHKRIWSQSHSCNCFLKTMWRKRENYRRSWTVDGQTKIVWWTCSLKLIRTVSRVSVHIDICMWFF